MFHIGFRDEMGTMDLTLSQLGTCHQPQIRHLIARSLNMSSKCKVMCRARIEHDQSIGGAEKTSIRACGACLQRAHAWEQTNLVWHYNY